MSSGLPGTVVVAEPAPSSTGSSPVASGTGARTRTGGQAPGRGFSATRAEAGSGRADDQRDPLGVWDVLGIFYGMVAGSLPHPKARYGVVLGPLVWASAYAVLPRRESTSRCGSTTRRPWRGT